MDTRRASIENAKSKLAQLKNRLSQDQIQTNKKDSSNKENEKTESDLSEDDKEDDANKDYFMITVNAPPEVDKPKRTLFEKDFSYYNVEGILICINDYRCKEGVYNTVWQTDHLQFETISG